MYPQNYPMWCAELREDKTIRTGLIVGWLDNGGGALSLRPVVAFHPSRRKPAAEIEPVTAGALMFFGDKLEQVQRAARTWDENTEERMFRASVTARLTAGQPLDLKSLTWVWGEILEVVDVFSEYLYLLLRSGAVTGIDGEEVVLTFPTALQARMAQGSDHVRLLADAIKHVLERPLRVRYEVAPQSEGRAP